MANKFCIDCIVCRVTNYKNVDEWFCHLYGEDVTGNFACDDFSPIEDGIVTPEKKLSAEEFYNKHENAVDGTLAWMEIYADYCVEYELKK